MGAENLATLRVREIYSGLSEGGVSYFTGSPVATSERPHSAHERRVAGLRKALSGMIGNGCANRLIGAGVHTCLRTTLTHRIYASRFVLQLNDTVRDSPCIQVTYDGIAIESPAGVGGLKTGRGRLAPRAEEALSHSTS